MTDFLKKPLGGSLNDVAIKRAQDASQKLGKSLPARVTQVISSGIVTVSVALDTTPFTIPQLTVPIAYPEYIRYPIQVGDKGLVASADAYLGSLTGLGPATTDLRQPTNLSALFFLWLGSSSWSAPDDPQALVLYAPTGVIIRDSGSTVKVKVTPSGGVEIDLPSGKDLTVNAAGGGKVNVVGGDVVIEGKSFLSHTHSGVTTGSGDTGPPV